MENAFARFAGGIAHLTGQADTLRNERDQLEHTIDQLRDRRAEIEDELHDIEAESLALARDYSRTTALATPFSTSNGSSPDPLQRQKPAVIPDDEDEDSIIVTPRRQARTAGKPTMQNERGVLAFQDADNAKPQQFVLIHPDFPTVIHLNGAWTEIWCGECGANALRKHPRMFAGMGGLKDHYYRSHEDANVRTLKATAEACARRVISPGDVHFMRAGQPPQDTQIKAVYGAAPKATSKLDKPIKQAMVTFPMPAAMRSTSPASVVPAKRVTVYETFQALEAEAKAIGTMKARKKRALGEHRTSDALGSSGYGEEEMS